MKIMNLNLLKKNKGFTLIEILVTFVISTLVILGISFSFKTIILGWDKTEKIYYDLQNFTYIVNLMKKNLSNMGENNLFKGGENYFIMLTNELGFHLPGLYEVGYFFEKNNLSICYKQINNFDEITNEAILKNSENCISFDRIENIKFTYGKKNKYKEIEFLDEINSKPDFVKVKIEINYINEEVIFEL